MTEYLIDYLTPIVAINYYASYCRSQYSFKIDNNGNVSIQRITNTDLGPRIETIDIHDNIPIPLYLIDILNMLIKPNDEKHICNYPANGEYYGYIIEIIKKLKTKLAELVTNPENKEDLELQLKFMFKKEELNKIEFNEMEQKYIKSIKNIQKYNEKLKEENHQLREEKNKSDEWRKNYNELYKNVSEVQVERNKLNKENIELTQLRKENVELQKLREDNHKLLKENYNLYKDLDNFRNKR
jgi:myosin heavy subunit